MSDETTEEIPQPSGTGCQDGGDILASVLASMSDGVVVADENGRFLHFNPAAERIMHVGPQEGGPERWHEQYGLYQPDQVTPIPVDQNPLVRAMRGESVEECSIFVRHARAPEGLWVSVNARPLEDRDGRRRGGVVVFRDVTAQMRAQAALARRTGELARSNADLEQYAYVASHDLQEPLRNIASYAELLGQRIGGDLDPISAGYLHALTVGAERMEVLVRDLLTLARVGAGKPVRETVACERLVDRILRDMDLRIRSCQGKVTRDPLPDVVGDSRQLAQLFQNLISNALKFHDDEPPRAHISARRGSREWVFSVQDHGIGIAAADADRIFGAFTRLHGRGVYPGTGIGLAICQKIVARHGGSIRVESAPGEGANFLFTLPDPHRAP
ncbi:MAG: ATP-binding protein [Acidobacteriota bacterium]